MSSQLGSLFVAELQRLRDEVEHVYTALVLPGWGGAQHGLPDTLYGYIMGAFARLDLFSHHWQGKKANDSRRMVDFMCAYMRPERRANSVSVNVWRHNLMHSASPRRLLDRTSGQQVGWLLHWGDEHLPREQHFQFQSGGQVLSVSLFGLLDDLANGLQRYTQKLGGDSELQRKFEKVAREIDGAVLQDY